MSLAAEPGAPIVPVNILVVDDHEENRMALRSVLSSPEYRIVEAESGTSALLRLLEEEFAVLLLDVVMPEMDGFELARTIKERERTAAVPIIFLTAVATDVELIYEGYRVGAVDYLVKPLLPQVVRGKVAVFAELFRQRKRLEEQTALLRAAAHAERELRLAERRIAELRVTSEHRYRTLAEAVPHIVWASRPDGTLGYLNHRWFEYTGLPMGEELGSWLSGVHPDDISRVRSEWQNARNTHRMFQNELRLRRADGTFRWHLARGLPLETSEEQTLSWLGTFTDIDDQKHAEGVLAEFKGTLDAVLDAVFIFGLDDSNFFYVNRGGTELLGYSQGELLRMQPQDVLVDYDAPRIRELLAPMRSGAKVSLTIEAMARHKDTRSVPIEISLQLIHAHGGRVVAIARDITERKRTQLDRETLYRQAIEAVRARDEFLSVASHELRTPLSSLQLQLETLLLPPRREDTAADLTSGLQIAARQVRRLSALVSDLLDVTRISAGRLWLEYEDCDLAAVARDVVSRFSEDAAKAKCSVELLATAPVVGKWDRMRMEQVVTNLFTNALKFGAGKPVTVAVEEHGALARLMVVDRGIGIATADVERVFQRYEQAATARALGGLGLGLYIVHQIVHAHRGTIRVQSEPGVGSTFTVELPREQPPAEQNG